METTIAVPMFGNSTNVRLTGIILALVTLVCPRVFALDPMGPAMSSLRQSESSVGFDYSHSKMDFELNDGTWVEHLDGVFFDAGEADTFTLKNFRMHKAYATFGYGLADGAEVFLRLGGADAHFGDSIWQDHETFDGDTAVAFGGGIRTTFYKEDRLTFGGLIQTSWTKFYGELWANHWASADSVEIELTEIQYALGLTYELAEGCYIYGGPFYHRVHGDLEDKFNESVDGSVLTSKYSWNIEQRSELGGYIGIQLRPTRNSSLNVEYQHTSSADAISANVMFRF